MCVENWRTLQDILNLYLFFKYIQFGPIPTVLFLLVVPEPENDIRNVNTTQHMSPDEGQALMKVKEGRGEI